MMDSCFRFFTSALRYKLAQNKKKIFNVKSLELVCFLSTIPIQTCVRLCSSHTVEGSIKNQTKTNHYFSKLQGRPKKKKIEGPIQLNLKDLTEKLVWQRYKLIFVWPQHRQLCLPCLCHTFSALHLNMF